MGTYMVTHVAVLLSQTINNVFYYDTDVGEPSDSEWQDIVDEIRSSVDTQVKVRLVTDYTFVGINRRRVDSAGLLSFTEIPTLGSLAGTNAADSVATQVAMLVSLKGTTTKPNRARSYLAGWGEDALTDSQWNPTERTAAEQFIDDMAQLNAGGTNPLSRAAAQWNASHTFVSVINDISGAAGVSSAVPATQRRRRIGVGI